MFIDIIVISEMCVVLRSVLTKNQAEVLRAH